MSVDDHGLEAIRKSAEEITPGDKSEYRLKVNVVAGSTSGTEYTEGDTDASISGGVVMWEDTSDTVVATSATKPLPVNIVSGSSSGTQYTEGDVDATITGTAVLWEDAGNTLSPVSSAAPLPVNIVAGSSSGTEYTEGDTDATITGSAILFEDAGDTLKVPSTTNRLPTQTTITDGTDTADVFDLTNSNPLVTALVDANGDQITSFGGGTQYTEGDVDASITGTALMWEDAANTLASVSAAKPLPVDGSGVTQPISAASLPLPTGAATETTLATIAGLDFATETTLASILSDTASLDAKDFATETTLAAILADTASLDLKDFATETTLAAILADTASLDLKDFATETTLAAILADTASLDAKDFATQTTLSAINAKLVSGTDIGDVTINNASGASAVNIQDGGNSITVDDGAGSLTVDGTVGVSGSVAVTNAALSVTGGGVEASALRVTIANDSTGVLSVDDNGGSLTVDGTVAATQSGTWNINNVSGTVSLPTGAATETTLSAINAKLVSGTDIGDVTINNASGASAVNVQDGGNSLTIDNAALSVTGGGTEASALRVTIASNSTGVLSVDDNGSSLTVDGTVAVSSVTTSITPGTAASNLGKAEDAAHASGNVGVMSLAVRNDTAATSFSGTNGDYTPIGSDAQGRVHTRNWAQQDSGTTLTALNTTFTSTTEVESGDITTTGYRFVDLVFTIVSAGSPGTMTVKALARHSSASYRMSNGWPGTWYYSDASVTTSRNIWLTNIPVSKTGTMRFSVQCNGVNGAGDNYVISNCTAYLGT